MVKNKHALIRFLKRELLEIEFLFVNYIVCFIPFWWIRRTIYRLLHMKIGRHTRIMMGVKIYSPHRISIGERTIINEYCYLDGRGGITIGDDVTIATYSKLITAAHDIDSSDFHYYARPIVIKNNVAIFSDSVVLGGAIIQKGCVFSAKSLIRKGEYPDAGIYAGNPAKYIRNRKSTEFYHQERVRLLFR